MAKSKWKIKLMLFLSSLQKIWIQLKQSKLFYCHKFLSLDKFMGSSFHRKSETLRKDVTQSGYEIHAW